MPPLREALAIYVQETPQSWNAAQSKYWLAIALAQDQQLAEAETLFLAAYAEFTEHLGQTPTWGRNHRRDTLQRLIALYRSQENLDAAARWQQELENLSTPSNASAAAAPP